MNKQYYTCNFCTNNNLSESDTASSNSNNKSSSSNGLSYWPPSGRMINYYSNVETTKCCSSSSAASPPPPSLLQLWPQQQQPSLALASASLRSVGQDESVSLTASSSSATPEMAAAALEAPRIIKQQSWSKRRRRSKREDVPCTDLEEVCNPDDFTPVPAAGDCRCCHKESNDDCFCVDQMCQIELNNPTKELRLPQSDAAADCHSNVAPPIIANQESDQPQPLLTSPAGHRCCCCCCHCSSAVACSTTPLSRRGLSCEGHRRRHSHHHFYPVSAETDNPTIADDFKAASASSTSSSRDDSYFVEQANQSAQSQSLPKCKFSQDLETAKHKQPSDLLPDVVDVFVVGSSKGSTTQYQLHEEEDEEHTQDKKAQNFMISKSPHTIKHHYHHHQKRPRPRSQSAPRIRPFSSPPCDFNLSSCLYGLFQLDTPLLSTTQASISSEVEASVTPASTCFGEEEAEELSLATTTSPTPTVAHHQSWTPCVTSILFILFALCHNLLRLLAKFILSRMLKNRRLWAFVLVFAHYTQATLGVEALKGGFRCNSEKRAPACLPKEYSKFDLPMKESNKISVTIDISEVLRINDKDYSITFACYFNVEWEERRIWLGPDFGREQAGPGVNTTMNPDIIVPMNLEFVKDLWLPNIFIYNLKTYKVIDVLSKLAGLWVSGDKIVLYSQATHITFICPMRFDKFPLDTQTCKFQVGSYSYDDTIMRFVTKGAGYSASKMGNSIALDYAIKIEKLKPVDAVFLGGSLGNFSLAGFEMVLHRYVSTYIITYYLPSGLFVIVSWISFLIPMDVIPGRMALLVTLFLVLVNIFNTVTTNTPKAEGLTAIEAWMLACILFVFGALIE